MNIEKRPNCWEVKLCGRQPSGEKVGELGICPATTDKSCDGINEGRNGGRICWAISGTFCGGKIQGTYAQKQSSCLACDFMQSVKKDGYSNSPAFGLGD